MSKLLLSIQAFTYSFSSEAFEAKRSYRKSLTLQLDVAKKNNDSSIESVRSKFGFRDLVCKGKMILMPVPSPDEDGESWPFDGRLGKLRYFGTKANNGNMKKATAPCKLVSSSLTIETLLLDLVMLFGIKKASTTPAIVP